MGFRIDWRKTWHGRGDYQPPPYPHCPWCGCFTRKLDENPEKNLIITWCDKHHVLLRWRQGKLEESLERSWPFLLGIAKDAAHANLTGDDHAQKQKT